ncbi:adenosylcobinamide amidohydrolase [Holophaga foetida]|uniref:adenosylcobinamide amidohydrolase n=1 Tax=Holophaga foetida TaxID=35839 RepID=UPI00024750BA|nr:adenosylcobinamide amidohydrolase [Holophaga foetida]
MILGTFYEGLELHREDRIVYGRFLAPHRVVSTCQIAGGMREDLQVVYNHQSCEPAFHCERVGHKVSKDYRESQRQVCERAGLPFEASASLGTAANMNCLGLQERRFRDLIVVAACTAGVEGNAGRAGDPAGTYEWEGRFERVSPVMVPSHGTINTLLFINRELTPGALVRSLMTATEAKSAALQDLVVGSKYSLGRATGTGTDQIASCCRLGTGIPLTSAGKHSILGQMIGEAVREAIKDALALQNGLTPDSQRSVLQQLKRFGLTHEGLEDGARRHLSEYEAELFRRNIHVLDADPLIVGAAAALAEVADQLRTGILPMSCARELGASLAAQMACAVSGNYSLFEECRMAASTQLEAFDPTGIAAWAMPRGFESKWKHLHTSLTEEGACL